MLGAFAVSPTPSPAASPALPGVPHPTSPAIDPATSGAARVTVRDLEYDLERNVGGAAMGRDRTGSQLVGARTTSQDSV